MLYFKTREEARKFKSGKFVDCGPSALDGHRWARKIIFKAE